MNILLIKNLIIFEIVIFNIINNKKFKYYNFKELLYIVNVEKKKNLI